MNVHPRLRQLPIEWVRFEMVLNGMKEHSIHDEPGQWMLLSAAHACLGRYQRRRQADGTWPTSWLDDHWDGSPGFWFGDLRGEPPAPDETYAASAAMTRSLEHFCGQLSRRFEMLQGSLHGLCLTANDNDGWPDLTHKLGIFGPAMAVLPATRATASRLYPSLIYVQQDRKRLLDRPKTVTPEWLDHGLSVVTCGAIALKLLLQGAA